LRVPDSPIPTVLVVGSRGFIGARIAAALRLAGHRVVAGDRPAMDLARDHDASAWLPRLEGVDIVVNAAGLLRESAAQSFEAVHARGPVALFTACAQRGIAVIQLSALGAAADAPTEFLRSKHRADRALLALDIPSAVLQPSLVYGPGGASAALFTMMASLPLIPLPGQGAQLVQPVHVDDVAEAVVRLIATRDLRRETIALVGPKPLMLREFLGALRAALGRGRARFVGIPMPLVRAAAGLGLGLLDRDSLAMLERGSTGNAARIRELLGREPRAVETFIPAAEARDARRLAALAWLRPVLVAAVALVWIATAIVSAGVYPVADSLALLARVGLTGTTALVALYGAAALDLVLGIATLVMRRRRLLWRLQAALIAGYMLIITFFLPEQWLHPYGPVTKNLPLLVALWLLHETESA
jgi:uncharacterized protein YbjT (DUF2867 family)